MSCGDPGLLEEGHRRCVVGDELAVGEGIGDEILRRRILAQRRCALGRQQHGDGVVETDGPPSTFWSPSISVPSSAFTPPIIGATISTSAPSLLAAALRPLTRSALTPSLTSTPILRPLKLFGPLAMIESFGDGCNVHHRRPGGVGRGRHLLQPQVRSRRSWPARHRRSSGGRRPGRGSPAFRLSTART